MPSPQKPMLPRTSARDGKMAWYSRSRTVGTSRRRIETGSKPPPGGNHGTMTENVKSSTMPSRKKGTDESSMNGGTRTCTKRGARGQVIKAPRIEPKKNEMMVETVSSASVQGTADWILS